MQIIDIGAVLSESPEDCLALLRGNPELTSILWAYEDVFSRVFRCATQNACTEDRGDRHTDAARSFLDTVYLRLIARPSDVVGLASMLASDYLAEQFLEDYVRHPMTKNHVLYNLARLPALFEALPKTGGWQEVIVHNYGASLLNSYPTRRFTLEELVPLGIEIDRPAARALLGSALESKQLTGESKARLLELFPNDTTLKRISELEGT
jgi:hypothetical protein